MHNAMRQRDLGEGEMNVMLRGEEMNARAEMQNKNATSHGVFLFFFFSFAA